jgi:hypothetical protein
VVSGGDVKELNENAKRVEKQKSAKSIKNAYIEVNQMASILYRRRKSALGLKGARAWAEWRRIQKNLLKARGLKPGED